MLKLQLVNENKVTLSGPLGLSNNRKYSHEFLNVIITIFASNLIFVVAISKFNNYSKMLEVSIGSAAIHHHILIYSVLN